MKKKLFILVGGTCTFIVCALIYLVLTRQMTIPFLYRLKAGNRYTIAVSKQNNPFVIDTASMKPLLCEDFEQHPVCKFMADPFIVRDSDDFYIFYEEMPSKMNSTWGDIAVLHSKDLEHWERIGVAIDEPFHMSFPNVFRYEGEWYMIPETKAVREIRLYKAVEFPLNWKHEKTLIHDEYAVDPAIVKWDDIWYILYSSSNGLRLCYADDLYSVWQEHPATPIRKNMEEQETRPAGNFIIYRDSLYCVYQRHDGGYGTSVAAYRIDSLSKKAFVETRLVNNPIIQDHGSTWAKDGMHQLSCIYLPEENTYVCVMDGNHVLKKELGWDWRNLPKFRFNVGK